MTRTARSWLGIGVLGLLLLVVAIAAWLARRDASPAEAPQVGESVAESPDLPPSSGIEVIGRVVTLEGAPVAGVLVVHRRLGGSRAVATSDAQGAFRGVVLKGDGWLTLESKGWAPTANGGVRWSAGEAMTIVAAPRGVVAGRVVDARGDPVARASVALLSTPEARERAQRHALKLPDAMRTTLSDASGSFRFDDAPVVPPARVLASCDPLDSARVELPRGEDGELTIVLPDPSVGRLLRGYVQDERHEPVQGAGAALGPWRSNTTAADGRFRMWLPPEWHSRARADLALVVGGSEELGVDYRPGFGALVCDPEAPLPFVTATLGPPLAIRVRARYADGRPVDLLQVEIDDKTVLAPDDSAGFLEDDRRFNGPSGFVELRNLLPREYRLTAYVLDLPWSIQLGPVRPSGDPITLTVDVPLAPVRFRVTTSDGAPATRAAVTLGLKEEVGANSASTPSHCRQWRGLDSQGRVSFENVPADGIVAHVEGNEILPRTVELPPLRGSEEIEIVVTRSARLRIEVAALREIVKSRGGTNRDLDAFGVQLLDTAGNPLTYFAWRGAAFVGRDETVPRFSATVFGDWSELCAPAGPCTLRVVHRASAGLNDSTQEVEVLRRELVLAWNPPLVIER